MKMRKNQSLQGGVSALIDQSKPKDMPIFPHARTIRKAREQASESDGRYWVSAQKDHDVFEKLGTVVGQNNSKNLGLSNSFISVYRFV